jgi:hypothetical protein
MFQKINALAVKLERIASKTAYVFEVVKWGLEFIREVAGLLSRFPKPIDNESNAVSKNSSDENPAGLPSTDGTEVREQPVSEQPK